MATEPSLRKRLESLHATMTPGQWTFSHATAPVLTRDESGEAVGLPMQNPANWHPLADLRNLLPAIIAALKRLEQLEEAARPFAKARIRPGVLDGNHVVACVSVAAGTVRKLAALLAKEAP